LVTIFSAITINCGSGISEEFCLSECSGGAQRNSICQGLQGNNAYCQYAATERWCETNGVRCWYCTPYYEPIASIDTSTSNGVPISDEPINENTTPIYWSRLNNINISTNYEKAINTPDISLSYLINTVPGIFTVTTMKFNNGVGSFASNNGYSHQAIMRPIGGMLRNWNKGSLSVWFMYTNDGSDGHGFRKGFISFGGDLSPFTGNHTNQHNQLLGSVAPPASSFWRIDLTGDGWVTSNSFVRLRYGNTQMSVAQISSNSMHHLFIIWNRDGLSDGTTIKIFIDGNLVISRNDQWPDANGKTFCVHTAASVFVRPNSTAGAFIDNLKIWDQIISNDASTEYNGGAGLEGY